MPFRAQRRSRFRFSLGAKIVLILIIFAAVPVIVYRQFHAADEEKTKLLLDNVRQLGQFIAASLSPLSKTFDARTAIRINERIAALGTDYEVNVKVLYRPNADTGKESFYYVAAWPKVSPQYLEDERRWLDAAGILSTVRRGCSGTRTLTQRFTNPDGKDELLASLTPIRTDAGCWVVITSYRTDTVLRSSLGRPYWQTPEVRIAAGIYFVMVVIVSWIFFNVWRNLLRFGTLAERISAARATKVSFRKLNRTPELDGVATAFDRMVGSLREVSETIRQTAEENAHALKAPIAVISQAVEPIRRVVPDAETPAARAIAMIEQSVARLDTLISAARRLDEATAAAIDQEFDVLDLSSILNRLIDGYRLANDRAAGSIRISGVVGQSLYVQGHPDMLETAVENILENAISFSPVNGEVSVGATRRGEWVEIAITDQGPGVDDARLERIFDRYHSKRPAVQGGDSAPHFGIGLWIARRNVTAMNGDIAAENRPGGGLAVTIKFPATSL